jgi:hypothetical protein
MSDEYVSLKALAAELGMDRSHARRYVLRLGVEPQKRRTPDSGGQLTLTVSASEAESIRSRRNEQGFLDSSKPVQNEAGFFYIIQLVPELDPKRIKLGFADDVNVRLLQHRTSAPTAVVLKSWPCKRSWEGTVIDALASIGGKLILNEVYEFEDVQSLLNHGEKLFALLPNPSNKVLLAHASPHLSKDA